MHSISSSLVSLRLLGTASVEGPDGPIVGRGTRGRRLALLALAATAGNRPIARDKLVAILWPEASADRARPLLSDSLYLVRSVLGDDAIVATGDELRLNGERVSSDVETFERLLGEEQYERAVAEYAGPFLDGFHVSDAVEFERWADGERARLAGRYADALGALAAAQEREQNWAGAVAWLRRLAAHDPYAGQVAVRLMRALGAAGNRAAALQHARVHAALLREEFGADPDPEISALAEQLKTESFPPASSTGPPPRLAIEVHEDTRAARLPAPDSAGPPAPAADSPTPAAAKPASHSLSSRSSPEPWYARRDARLVALVLAVVAAGIAVLVSGRGDAPRAEGPAVAARPSALAPQQSIAVLPFDDMGPRRDGAYFSDGLTEEIIGLLSRVEGLRVAARSSSFALRDAKLDARTMGDTLRVATLLEGSVRRAGDRIRVTTQLVDVASGYQLWSKSYDRRMADVIALQHDIATAIVSALQLELGPSETGRASRSVPNPEAYDLYLRGVYARNKLTGEEFAKAIDYFDRAIRLDSAYAPAYAGKATTIGPIVWFGQLPRAQGAPLIRRAARRAVELDETLPEAHVALGMVAFFFDWDWPVAEREFRRAIELNPNDAPAHHFLATFLKAMGRFDEAISERTRALELDPLSARTGMSLGSDYFVAGQYELAAKHFRRASELDPRSPIVLGLGPGVNIVLGDVYERQGNDEAAVREYLKNDSLSGVPPTELTRLRSAFDASGIRGYWRGRVEQMERDPSAPADPVRLARMWTRVGDTERTVRNLERAYRERSLGLVFLGVLPDFAAARADPRVMAILEPMHLRPIARPLP